MKAFAATLLVGAAAAAPQQQQILGNPKVPDFSDFPDLPKQGSDFLSGPLHELKETLKTFGDDARGLWDEVATLFPDALNAAPFFSLPKKHTSRPDSKWDHIVRGSDIQSVWVQNENGEEERDIDGKLETYDLRVKKVDPSKLGIDPGVKQYSGYLDDNENDKHLFYCMSFPRLNFFASYTNMRRVLRV